METVNLKSAITFRVDIHGKPAAFTTKTFRGERTGPFRDETPGPHDRVPYMVHEIVLASDSVPWFKLAHMGAGNKPVRLTIMWSNVLSVQADPEEEVA